MVEAKLFSWPEYIAMSGYTISCYRKQCYRDKIRVWSNPNYQLPMFIYTGGTASICCEYAIEFVYDHCVQINKIGNITSNWPIVVYKGFYPNFTTAVLLK